MERMNYEDIKSVDPEVWKWIKEEVTREKETINLIASENFAPHSILSAQGSLFTKHASSKQSEPWRNNGNCHLKNGNSHFTNGNSHFRFCKSSFFIFWFLQNMFQVNKVNPEETMVILTSRIVIFTCGMVITVEKMLRRIYIYFNVYI